MIENPFIGVNQPYRDDISQLKETSQSLSGFPTQIDHSTNFRPFATAELTQFAVQCYLLNKQFRQWVKSDEILPPIVRSDTPSLRSTIWMIMVDEALSDSGIRIPKPADVYPWRLYAL